MSVVIAATGSGPRTVSLRLKGPTEGVVLPVFVDGTHVYCAIGSVAKTQDSDQNRDDEALHSPLHVLGTGCLHACEPDPFWLLVLGLRWLVIDQTANWRARATEDGEGPRQSQAVRA